MASRSRGSDTEANVSSTLACGSPPVEEPAAPPGYEARSDAF
jgi:hypothetical protein